MILNYSDEGNSTSNNLGFDGLLQLQPTRKPQVQQETSTSPLQGAATPKPPTRRPGIDFTKLHFRQKTFGANFHLRMLDKFHT
jgi:hypothetical protein